LSICGDLFRHRDEFKQKECMNYEHVNIWPIFLKDFIFMASSKHM
jgi:hypothetical protein